MCQKVVIGLAFLLSASCRAASLGGAPVCEASAVQAVACPSDPLRSCWLVADNEERKRVFVYQMRADSVEPDVASRREMKMDEISDMEALARTSRGNLLFYGSHSRNKRCEVRANRRVFTELRFSEEGGLPPVMKSVRSPAIDWSAVFGADAKGDLARVADAVVRGEAAADAGDCSSRFDIEAAVVIPTPAGDQVWLGLRTPIVDGRAVLVRHDRSDGTLRFVDARLLDLGGRGARGLDYADGWVYGLSPAGSEDERGPFRLWRFRAERLSDAGPISVAHVAEVPSASEGVAIHAGHAIVVQDGSEGSPTCKEDARYILVPLGGVGER